MVNIQAVETRTMISKKWVVIIIILVFTGVGMALDPGKAITQYMMESWNDENGLPSNTVRKILQTQDGYLWLGTEEGLVRFDGVNMTRFDDTNTPEMTSNYIFTLFQDRQGRLWIGTVGGGLLVYEKGAFKRLTNKEGFPSTVVHCIFETKEGCLWIGTDGDGVYCREGQTFKRYTKTNGLIDDVIHCFCEDMEGTLWIGTQEGLSSFSHGIFKNYTIGEPGKAETVKSILIDQENHFWVGTTGGFYQKENEVFAKYPIEIQGMDTSYLRVGEIMEDRDGNTWICAAQKGLIRFKDGGFSVLTKENGLPDDVLMALVEDHEGSIWVGTGFSGVSRLKDGKFAVITRAEGLSDNIVFPVIQDSKGYIWIGTNQGLNRYDPTNKTWTYMTTAQGLSNNGIFTLYEDRMGRIWVGTDDGLNLLTHTPAKITKIKEFMRTHYILSVYVDKAGTVWAGTLDGLFCHRGKDFEKLTDKDGVMIKVVNLMFEDSQGRLWISNYRKGVLQYTEEGTYKAFNQESGLSSNTVNCLHEDEEGVLWFGTNQGLTRLKEGKATVYKKKDGLFNDNIYQVLQDGNGYLWMSSNKGIYKIRKEELTDFAIGKINHIDAIAYGKEDGMRSSECNGGYQAAGCKTRDGRLWFPSMKGVVVVDTGKMPPNPEPPRVYIEKVWLDGEPVPVTESVEVKPGVKSLEFNFTALSYLNPRRVEFKYQLEGYDDGWVNAGQRRAAWYTNLDGGSYVFRVIACNNDGVWNEKGASLSLTVIPPFWNTWWFRIVALIAFAVFSYLVIHLIRKFITLSAFWKKKKYIDKFKLLDQIGSGGMGTIYKAENMTNKGETVALKVLREDMFTDEAVRKRFKQEAAIIDQLDHPNIVRVFERGHSKQHLYISMELLEGCTLSEKIRIEKRLAIPDAVHIMSQMADALVKIHSKNIVHRDLKPDNIMLVRKGPDVNFVKLLDFGLARMEHQTRLTQTGMVMGTLSYISPEQVSGTGAYPASDVYGLGVIFFEMVTGEKPFTGPTTIDIMKLILDNDPVEPIRYRPEVGSELNALILSMMAKDPNNRPPVASVKDFLITYGSRYQTIVSM